MTDRQSPAPELCRAVSMPRPR